MTTIPENLIKILDEIHKENLEIVKRYIEGYVTKEDVEIHCVAQLGLLIEDLPKFEDI